MRSKEYRSQQWRILSHGEYECDARPIASYVAILVPLKAASFGWGAFTVEPMISLLEATRVPLEMRTSLK